jgi:hypothetical protein
VERFKKRFDVGNYFDNPEELEDEKMYILTIKETWMKVAKKILIVLWK